MTTNQPAGQDRDTHGVPVSDAGSARFLPGMDTDMDLSVLDGDRVLVGGMDLTLIAQQAARAAHALALPRLDQELPPGTERPDLDRDDSTGHPRTDRKILDHARAADQATHTALRAGYAAVDLSETLAVITRTKAALEALSMATTIALDQAIRIQDTAEKTLSRHQQEIEHLQTHPTGPHVLAESSTIGTVDTPANTPGYRSPAEISRAARISPATARRGLRAATRLRRDMPNMFTALATGTITIDAAYTVARRAGSLTRAQRRTADQMLDAQLPALTSKAATSWDREMTGLIGHLAPDGAEARHRKAVTDRHVTISPAPDGMGHVNALLPALDAAAIRKKLSLTAEQTMSTGNGHGRSHGQVEADTLTDLLLERGDGLDPVGLDVAVVVTDRTLFSPAHNDPATIEGLGVTTAAPIREKITATLPARRLHLTDQPSATGDRVADDTTTDAGTRPGTMIPPVRGAQAVEQPVAEDPFEVDTARVLLRRVLTDPDSGQLVAMESVARTFPTGLARMIRMRDEHTCQGPYCGARIRHLDHIDPHSQGGPTSLENGQGLCEYCNLVKELTGTTRLADNDDEGHDPPLPGHTIVWETRTGRRDRVTAPPLIPGTRPPLPVAPPGHDPDPSEDSVPTGASAPLEESAASTEPDPFTPAPWDMATLDEDDEPEDLWQPTLAQLDAIHAAHRTEYEHAPWPDQGDDPDPDDYTHAA
jgi:hypothetical protein